MFNFKPQVDGTVMLYSNGVSYCFDFQTGRAKVCKKGEWFQRSKMF